MRIAKLLAVFLFVVMAVPASASTEDPINGRMSGNWSGYVATKEKYTGVGATWVVPTVEASTTLMTNVTWVGIGGSKTKDLIQAGTHGATQNGKLQYWAWYELLPDYQKVIPLVVAGGDKVTVSLTEVTEDLWLLYFVNLTTGQMHSQVLEYNSRYSSAEWIEEMPTVYNKAGDRLYAPLSEFESTTFEDGYAMVGDKRLSIEDARARAVTMVSKQNKKVVLATPQQIVDEDTFTVLRSEAVPSPLEYGSGKRNRALPWEILWTKASR
jgi:hypothetical protein